MISLEKLDNIKIHFIVAQPRTGSTLLATMFNQHEEVICNIEQSHAFFLYEKYNKIRKWTKDTIRQFCDDFYLFSTLSLSVQFSSKEVLFCTLEKYLDHLTFQRAVRISYLCFYPNKDKSKITTVVNKGLISYNFIEKLAIYYPKSKFILLQRAPLDTIARQLNLLKVNGKNTSHVKLAFRWNYSFKRISKKSSNIDLERKYTLLYENLILNTESELKQITHFLDLSFEDKMHTYSNKNNSSSQIYTIEKRLAQRKDPEAWLKLHEGVSKPADANKIGIWKQEISKELANIAWSIAGETAVKMGYKIPTEIQVQKKTVPLFFKYLTFMLKQIIIRLWYLSPFWVKRDIKLIKIRLKNK